MANSLLKLTVESSEYDAKLKKAAEGVRHLADVAHKSAGDMTGLEQSTLDYIKSIGEMETKSRSAAGQVRELESTYKELKVIYDQLNDVEKADEGGKALAASLEQLKQRAQDAKKSLDDASKSLQQNEDEGKKTSGVLDQLASKFTVNIDALKLFNIGLQAAGVALDVAKDAFFASEATVDEWGRTMDASKSLYEGFLTALNTGDISGYLNNINDIVTAARQAYDELDRLGTMKTIQSPKMSAQQTENDRMRMMIQTGRYIAPVDGRKASMAEGQQLTKAQIQTLESQLQNGMKTVVGIVGDQVKQTGKAIDAVYNRQAKELGMSVKEFRKGTSSMAEFDKRMEGYQKYKEWNAKAQTDYARQGGRGSVNFDKSNPYAEFKKWGTFRVDGERYNSLVQLIQQRDQQAAQAYGMQSQAYRTMNRANGTTLRQIMGGGSGSGKTGKGGTTTPTYAEDSIAAQQALVSELTNKWNEAGQDMQQGYVQQLVEAEAKLKQMKDDAAWMKDLAAGKYSLQDYHFKEGMQGAMTERGAESLRFAPKFEENMKDSIAVKAPLQLDEKAMKAVNRQLSKISKDDKKEEKSFVDVMGQVNQGIGSIVSGIEGLGIELPQGMRDMVSGINSVLSVLQGITVLVQGIAAMQEIGTWLGIIPGHANGGIVPHAANGYYVPGNSFSGDNTMIMANAGELVLNKAAQGNLASQLNGGGMQNIQLEAVVTGEQIMLASNNRGRRTGRGEIVQSNKRR